MAVWLMLITGENKMSKQVKVKKSEPPESKEVLAEAIVNIGSVVKKLNANGMNKKAMVVLIHDFTRVPKGQIITILDSLPQLERWYCK